MKKKKSGDSWDRRVNRGPGHRDGKYRVLMGGSTGLLAGMRHLPAGMRAGFTGRIVMSRLLARIALFFVVIPLMSMIPGPTARAEPHAAGKLSIGYREDAPPFSARAERALELPPGYGGAYSGFAADICRAVVDAVATYMTPTGFTEFPVNAANRFTIADGEGREFDMLCDTTSISQERLELCSFSFPYFVTGISFITAGSKLTAAELAGLELGLVGGTTTEERLRKEWHRRFGELPEVAHYEDYSTGAAAVGSGRLDVLFGDRILLEQVVADQKGNLSISDDILSTELYAFCVNPGRSDLLKITNLTLARLYASGEIYGLISEHFGGRGASRLLVNLYAFYALPE